MTTKTATIILATSMLLASYSGSTADRVWIASAPPSVGIQDDAAAWVSGKIDGRMLSKDTLQPCSTASWPSARLLALQLGPQHLSHVDYDVKTLLKNLSELLDGDLDVESPDEFPAEVKNPLGDEASTHLHSRDGLVDVNAWSEASPATAKTRAESAGNSNSYPTFFQVQVCDSALKLPRVPVVWVDARLRQETDSKYAMSLSHHNMWTTKWMVESAPQGMAPGYAMDLSHHNMWTTQWKVGPSLSP